MTSKTYPTRDWIPAKDSFAAQPDALRGMVDHLAEQLDSLPAAPQRAVAVGIGASHAAVAPGIHRMRSQGRDITRHLPEELPVRGDTVCLDRETLVVAVSQSGRSAEVVDLARRLSGQQLVTLTNYSPSPLGDLASTDINLGDHSDSAVSFLSFTGTMLAFGMIADAWAGRLDVAHWRRTTDAALRCAEAAAPQLETVAETLAGEPFVDVVAPAPLLGSAEEAALTFREGPLLAATGMETRLYLHGPMDVAGSGAHLVIGGDREALLIEQLAERTDKLAFIASAPRVRTPETTTLATMTIDVPHEDEVGQSIAAAIMAQRLSLRIAELRGVAIDQNVFERLDTKTNSARSAR